MLTVTASWRAGRIGSTAEGGWERSEPRQWETDWPLPLALNSPRPEPSKAWLEKEGKGDMRERMFQRGRSLEIQLGEEF